MARLYNLCVAFLLVGSLFIPGHVRQAVGWMGAFALYGATYLLAGMLVYKGKLQRWPFYAFLAGLFLLLPVFTWFDYRDFWYPQLMPAFMLIGATSFLAGYFAVRKKKLAAVAAIFGAIVLYITLFFRINYYLYQTFVDPPSFKESLGTPAILKGITDLDGRPVNPETWKGKVVIMDCWFIECASCMEKMPLFDSLYRYYSNRSDVVFLSVVDGSVNTLAALKQFLSTKKIGCPVLYDAGGQMIRASGFRQAGYPIEVRIGKDGRIEQMLTGCPDARFYFTESVKTIDALINEN